MFDWNITMDSFGEDCPTNWEEIADFLNAKIDSALGDSCDPDDARRIADQIWEEYWTAYHAGELTDDQPKPITRQPLWYAVQQDKAYDDWGYGSYDLIEAKRMLRAMRKEYPESLIAVIDETDSPNSVCVDEIYDID